jgi:hypothetical protein
MASIGQHVTYVDSLGNERNALVTYVGIPGDEETWVNVVVVNSDPKQEDSYGRKIERFTSVSHQNKYGSAMHGNYWKP